MNKSISIKQIIALQSIVLIYTFANVFSKCASDHKFLSFWWIIFYGAEICVLGIYAVLWQQMIKRVDLSLAYANRATAVIWSLVWSLVIFGDAVKIQNIIGVVIIVAGTVIVNSEHD